MDKKDEPFIPSTSEDDGVEGTLDTGGPEGEESDA